MRFATHLAAAAVAIAAAAGLAGAAHAASALAVGVTDNPRDGLAYGWAVNYETVDEARREAMRQCRDFKDAPRASRQCRLIGAADKLCMAIAFDPDTDSSGMGWAVAATLTEAQEQAVDNCRAAAPRERRRFCKLDNSKCDGRQ